ncbi:unnamed protein product, partial [Pylaiella littoralis]
AINYDQIELSRFHRAWGSIFGDFSRRYPKQGCTSYRKESHDLDVDRQNNLGGLPRHGLLSFDLPITFPPWRGVWLAPRIEKHHRAQDFSHPMGYPVNAHKATFSEVGTFGERCWIYS